MRKHASAEHNQSNPRNQRNLLSAYQSVKSAIGIQSVKSAKIIIYQKPTCTTCRQVFAILKESGVDFESVNYYVDAIPKTKLKQLLKKMGITARELLRSKEAVYEELKLGERDLNEEEFVDVMVRHPDLIERPIVERGGKAILARPAARVREIL